MGPPISGHVFRTDGKRGGVWHAKYRLPDGRQVKRRIGPAWSGRGRPLVGYFTRRLAEDWLRDTLEAARRGELPGLVQTGATVPHAAAEFLRFIEHDRQQKPSTVKGYRWLISRQILPALGETRLEDLTQARVEEWFTGLSGKPSSKRKTLVVLHGVIGTRASSAVTRTSERHARRSPLIARLGSNAYGSDQGQGARGPLTRGCRGGPVGLRRGRCQRLSSRLALLAP